MRECPGVDYYVNFKKYLSGEPAVIMCYCGEEFTEEQYQEHVLESAQVQGSEQSKSV